MGEEEQVPDQPEASEGFDSQQVVEILQELKAQGVDFEEEDFEHVVAMPPDEAMEYLIVALEIADYPDIESLLIDKGLVSFIDENPDEVKEIQNRGQPFVSEEVDQIIRGEK